MFVKREMAEPFLSANEFFPVLLVTGARQVGKTTLLRKIAEKGRGYVSLDPLDVRQRAKEDPRLFLADNPPPVIIDEIQYVPELLPYIKEKVDEVRTVDSAKACGMYWLTGSQKFELMQDVSESLAGRIAIFDLHGLSNREKRGVKSEPFLPEKFMRAKGKAKTPAEVFRAIWLGSYPELSCHSSAEKYWTLFYQSYVQTYLERDVRKLAQVADLGVYFVFMKAVAARSGQMLNYADLARDVGVSQPTIKKYVSVLETSNIIRLLYPYRNNQSALMVSTPKLYMLDTGLMAFLTDWKNPEVLASGAMAGHFFETWCVAEVIKSYVNAGEKPPLFYYRDREANPNEIDIVIERDKTLYPIEIKRSATPNKNDVKKFSRLSTFKLSVGTGALISLYPNISHLTEDTVTIPAWLL